MSADAPFPLRRGRVHEVLGPGAFGFALIAIAQTDGPALWIREGWRSGGPDPLGLARILDPDRLLIACALVDGERSVRELEDLLGIRQPGLSQQLAELREAGLVTGRKQGKQVFYSLADPRIARFIATMHALFCAPRCNEG